MTATLSSTHTGSEPGAVCRSAGGGNGKTAVSTVIASEVSGEFTVIYVDAQAGALLLTVVVKEAKRLGGPTLGARGCRSVVPASGTSGRRSTHPAPESICVFRAQSSAASRVRSCCFSAAPHRS